tara:strand:- start:8 stop:1906 length:1899 start_codon:yes stop_codon:yes gene_type:complete
METWLIIKSQTKGAEHMDNDILPAIAAEYKGKKVTLNKPFRTSGGKKKFAVYVQNSSGRVVIVRFGDPNMEIKRDDPKRRKAFRDRHNCSEKKDRTTPGYWSCRQWRSGNKVEASLHDDWMENEQQPIFEDIEEIVEACCDDCSDHAEAKREDDPCEAGWEQYGMKMKNGRKVPNCIPMKTKKAALPSPEKGETHAKFMTRCEQMGNSSEDCMSAHEGHDFPEEASYDDKEKEAGYGKVLKRDNIASEESTCPIGEELVAGICKPVNVTMEISVDTISAKVEATTGQSIIEIKGIAFHEGYNKNNWALTRRGAEAAVEQMFGADLTLNHPKAKDVGFGRNTDGGVNEANVGVVISASIHDDLEQDKYEVRYVAHVVRAELFEALESGLWLKPEYGVSIGGYGMPIKADEDGMIFDTDFTFDHLAIVHKPAYNRANIEEVKRIDNEIEVASTNETFIAHSLSGMNQPKVNPMTEEPQEETILASEHESIQAELVLARAEIEQFKANEAAKVEEVRAGLVLKASELGLKGHEDLSESTLTSLIASWESSRPVVEEKVLSPATPASEEVIASEEIKADTPVVASYLNGKMVETPEKLYAQAWNAWASTWNGTLSGHEMSDSRSRAPKYSELKEMN